MNSSYSCFFVEDLGGSFTYWC